MKSVLTMNANDPKMLLDATLYGADAVLFDLTIAAQSGNQDAARILLQEAIAFFDYSSIGILVKPNLLSDPDGEKDFTVVGKSSPCAFIVPAATPDFVAKADGLLAKIEADNNLESGKIGLIPAVETAIGVEQVAESIAASPRVWGILFDGQKFLADLGTCTCACGEQLVYAKSKIALACRIANVMAIDTPYLGKDEAGLKEDAKKSKFLGFTGKVAANGNQINAIQAAFA